MHPDMLNSTPPIPANQSIVEMLAIRDNAEHQTKLKVTIVNLSYDNSRFDLVFESSSMRLFKWHFAYVNGGWRLDKTTEIISKVFIRGMLGVN